MVLHQAARHATTPHDAGQGDGSCAPPTICSLGLAAHLLDRSEAEVLALLESGEIAACNVTGRWEIDMSSLRAYAQRQGLA